MGNPTKYIGSDGHHYHRPSLNTVNKTVSIYCGYYGDGLPENLTIDMYQAPDCISYYPGGFETVRDEYVRYERYEFTGVKVIEKPLDIEGSHVTFTYETFNYHYSVSDDDHYKDIPIGKWRGHTVEEIVEHCNLYFQREKHE